tara:strand:+ start:587 stop:1795 length:1209 start_codon:yes stop_codon:yes gene_type:complete
MTNSPQTCTRCTINATVPQARFDENGICNYCALHDEMEKEFPLTGEGKNKIDQIIKDIKKAGNSKKYDCVIGISGGRDSTYTLYMAKKWGLRPLAVYFNDGFGNPVAGQNMKRATFKLGVDMRTVTADWRESKCLKVACLKASTPDLNLSADLGIACALYGVAAAENLRYIFIGQSFRTEGIAPLEWNYLDGKYLATIHKQFGAIPLRKWRPKDPGFRLELVHMVYYIIWRRIRTITPLYYLHYVRSEVDEIITRELDWKNPGAHYGDDLYQSLLSYILRTKFKIDRRRYNDAALVRSGQMTREKALKKLESVGKIEDPKVIDLCIKRLGLTKKELNEILDAPIKTFWDYPNLLSTLRRFSPVINFFSKLDLIPKSSYKKYCGDHLVSPERAANTIDKRSFQ